MDWRRLLRAAAVWSGIGTWRTRQDFVDVSTPALSARPTVRRRYTDSLSVPGAPAASFHRPREHLYLLSAVVRERAGLRSCALVGFGGGVLGEAECGLPHAEAVDRADDFADLVHGAW